MESTAVKAPSTMGQAEWTSVIPGESESEDGKSDYSKLIMLIVVDENTKK